MLKKRFKEYFSFTKKERNGIFVLLLILILLISITIYQNSVSYGEITLMDEEFLNDIEKFEKSLVSIKENKEKQDNIRTDLNEKEEENIKPIELFEFDPNIVSKSELIKLGFSEKQIQNLLKYREKGGKFFCKTDLQKIYGIEKEQYEMLEPYINIQPTKESTKTNDTKHELSVEINSAEMDDLIKLKGVGKVYAEKIIKYRNKLGGFYKKDQLLEINGLDSARFFGFCDNINIDTSLITKLNLNESDYKTLIKHP